MKLFTALLMALSLSAAAKAEVPVELAYRDSSATNETDRRTVILQGLRDGSSSRFDAACGQGGARCECLFYFTGNEIAPLRGSSIGVSTPNNSLACLIPGSRETPDMVNFVQLHVRTGGMLTGKLALKTALTLDDVLGAKLLKQNVRGIFRYTCDHTFFEGEGVSASQIACVPGQHLGVITATYSFYTYRSQLDGNFPSGDSAFPGSICERNNFLQTQCTGHTPELRYGFYRENTGPFVVAVSMTRGPTGDNLTSLYGYAAIPDEHSRCPIGLVKVRPWIAQPASMVPSGPHCPENGCPTNFVNPNNSLGNTVVETAEPSAFLVTRKPNQVPCDAVSGSCVNAAFGGASVAQSARYTAAAPEICVIPPALLNGLF
ncbi:MAG: hypothetical protein ACXVCK_06355 [Bdellovibrionota bacterium]